MDIIKLEKGKWYPIVDYPDYEMNSDGLVRSLKKASPAMLSCKRSVRLFKDGIDHQFSIKNILLSIMLGISPEQTRNLCFVNDGAGPRYLTRDEFNKTVASKALREKVCSEDMVNRCYYETERMIGLIRKYYISGDLSEIASFLTSFEKETKAYLYKTRRVFSIEDVELCWSSALESALVGIVKRNRPVIMPSCFLKNTARKCAKQIKSSRRIFRGYDENDNQMGYMY